MFCIFLFFKLPASGGLHRQTVWELSAGGVEDQTLSSQLPWLTCPCLPLLHLSLRPFTQIFGPGHYEETGQQGRFLKRFNCVRKESCFFLCPSLGLLINGISRWKLVESCGSNRPLSMRHMWQITRAEIKQEQSVNFLPTLTLLQTRFKHKTKSLLKVLLGKQGKQFCRSKKLPRHSNLLKSTRE